MGRVEMRKNEEASNLQFSRPFADGEGRGGEKCLALCEHYSAVRRTPLYYLHCFQHKSKHNPVPAATKRNISTPAKTNTHLHKLQPRRDHFSAALAVCVLRVAATIKKGGFGFGFLIWFGLLWFIFWVWGRGLEKQC